MIDQRMSPENESIQVVVRCRGRNAKETSAKSAVVVGIQCEESDEVVLNPSDDTGVSAQLNSRVYRFDKVFGPTADQDLLFKSVADPLFNEFLKGYNCTLLVYGMTSTGKTYTMTGDCISSDGNLSDNAGIIPRVLLKLFSALDDSQNVNDYIVKCSFIELYNEELKDLLSDDQNKKLRIYDQKPRNSGVISPTSLQTNKATIHIQNLEEVRLKNATHGLKILQKGLELRQVAATKMNDVSSRSHTIFTLNLFKQNKETHELFRISKMNLVDLAGSENISKSGALNQRAKEAGSINQSLLTLGRVINLLVEKQQHIPYRESKLTRLLQDSLGGRTKTCLIATISPAKVNYEETQSTLEYANKAKSIQNKPQLGSTLSKDILVKELSVELAKLKADLDATKTKDGLYMNNDNYQEMTNDLQEYKTEVEEQKRIQQSLNKQNEQLKSQIAAVEFQNTEQATIINTLNATIESLHNKIDKQRQNEQNLMSSSSKFKNVLNIINSNLVTFKKYEAETKAAIVDISESTIQKTIDDIVLKLKESSSSESITEEVSSIKNEVNDVIQALQNSTFTACKNVSDIILSKFPTLFEEFEGEVHKLRCLIDSLESSLNYQFSKLSKENNDLKMALNDKLFNNHNPIIDNAISFTNQQLEKESNDIMNRLVTMLKQNASNQKELITRQIKAIVSDVIGIERSHLRPIQESWDQSTRVILNTCDSKTNDFKRLHDDELAHLTSKIKVIDSLTSTSKSFIDEELNKINQIAIKFQNENQVHANISKINEKFSYSNHAIKSLSSALSKSKFNLDLASQRFQSEIIANDETSKLESQDIDRILSEIDTEQSQIKKASLPTGKTPKREALNLPNRPSETLIQSPPKFQLIGQRFQDERQNKENLPAKRKLNEQLTLSSRKMSNLTYFTSNSRIPKRK